MGYRDLDLCIILSNFNNTTTLSIIDQYLQQTKSTILYDNFGSIMIPCQINEIQSRYEALLNDLQQLVQMDSI